MRQRATYFFVSQKPYRYQSTNVCMTNDTQHTHIICTYITLNEKTNVCLFSNRHKLLRSSEHRKKTMRPANFHCEFRILNVIDTVI